MTDLDTLLRDGLQRATDHIADPTPADVRAIIEGPSPRPLPRQGWRVVLVAAVVALLAAAAVVLADRGGPPREHVTTTTPPRPTVDLTDLGPGWHPLDTGPVPAMSTVDVAWTGTDLIVVGTTGAAAEAYAYDSAEEKWTELPGLPSDVRGSLGLAWTGDVLLAVEASFPAARAYVWSPTEKGGWVEIDHPPASQALVDLGQGMGPVDRSGPALVWTGERVLDLTHGAAWDPTTGSWTEVPMPSNLLRFSSLSSTNPVWDGEQVVAVAWVEGRGLAWDAKGREVHEVEGPPQDSAEDGYVLDSAAIGSDGSLLLIAGAEDGRTLRRDAGTGAWAPGPPMTAMADDEGCPGPAVAVSPEVVVAAPCFGPDLQVLTGDRWAPLTGRPGPTYRSGGDLLGAGGALISWRTSNDEFNDPDAPYVDAAIWVPPA